MRAEWRETIIKNHLDKREIILNDDITDSIIELVLIAIKDFNEEDDKKEKEKRDFKRDDNPIKIYINTFGGSVYEMMALISEMKISKTPIYTYGLGKVISAGFYIFMAGSKRFAYTASTFMYHDILMSANSETTTSVRNRLDYSKKLLDYGDKFIASRCSLTVKELKDIRDKNMDYYLMGEEAHDLGIVTDLLDKEMGEIEI